MAHKHISEITADEAMVLIGNFAHRVKLADAAARKEESKIGLELGKLPEDSVEYALAVCALASQEFESQRAQFADLVRLLNRIRPPRTGGAFKTRPVPPEFGDMWPHERLGHCNWTSFVTTKRSGERDPNDETKYRKPPGLGWSKQYESNIAKGFERIQELVSKAMPQATQAERESKVNEVTQGAGQEVTRQIGEKLQSTVTLDVDASAAVDALASGSVVAEDIRERGAEALTDPRPKGRQRGATAIDRAMSLVRKMSEADVYEFKRQFQDYMLSRVTGGASG